jgi:hypothetical protein
MCHPKAPASVAHWGGAGLWTAPLLQCTRPPWQMRVVYVTRLPDRLLGPLSGGGAALAAAALLGTGVKAVVSRGGRPDLAMPVRAPCCLLPAAC